MSPAFLCSAREPQTVSSELSSLGTGGPGRPATQGPEPTSDGRMELTAQTSCGVGSKGGWGLPWGLALCPGKLLPSPCFYG